MAYTATVTWERAPGEPFTDTRYGRGHRWAFDGGVVLRASSSPHVVPRHSDPAGVDPEEAFVASLSSCHMLTFLHKARLAGFIVTSYRDHASGVMEEIAPGRAAVTRVTLKPQIEWDGDAPDAQALAKLHHEAHEECFIANSVLTEITVEPR